MPDAPPPTLGYVPIFFEETQALRVWWVWAIGLGVPLIPLSFILHGVITGRAPIAAAVIGGTACALPGLLMAVMRLRVTVTSERVRIRLWPIRKSIAIDAIVSAEASTYRFREFGGWGLRYSLRDSTTAYTMSGYEGVRLVTTKGGKLLIGSQKPVELEKAIRDAMAMLTPPAGSQSP